MQLYMAEAEPIPGVRLIIDLSPVQRLEMVKLDYAELNSEHNQTILSELGRRLLVVLRVSESGELVLATSRLTHLAIVDAIVGPDGSSRFDHQQLLYEKALVAADPEFREQLELRVAGVQAIGDSGHQHSHRIFWHQSVPVAKPA